MLSMFNIWSLFFCDGPINEAYHWKKWFEFFMTHDKLIRIAT
jgi:hypothetical protein